MTTRPPRPGQWKKVTLPDGRRAMVTTRVDSAGGQVVVVKPIRPEE